ncbi:hypothetical protein HYO65_gp131 [Tenacibaculum phage PTm1]|uniref:Uncharacterized protein n=2 Tax=Shirahamavirus PTm1 TaxID=2846435 RepID=A0A5S9EQM3_9CAUD|nr:hypothetical protein HYO65_gp131 [Tenacibaculum phage PTm1]BBI90523.1 hypothetical protein [Tenacibaculum phage PTm1]BBI90831.1 hypothetical protein [Tenacibaculum phage PTm5]
MLSKLFKLFYPTKLRNREQQIMYYASKEIEADLNGKKKESKHYENKLKTI